MKNLLLIALAVTALHLQTALPGTESTSDQPITAYDPAYMPRHESPDNASELETTIHAQQQDLTAEKKPVLSGTPTSDSCAKRTALLQQFRADTAKNFVEIDGIKIGLDKVTPKGWTFFQAAILNGLDDLVGIVLKTEKIKPSLDDLMVAIRQGHFKIARSFYPYNPQIFNLKTAVYLDDVNIAAQKVTPNSINVVCDYSNHDPENCRYTYNPICQIVNHQRPIQFVKSVAMARLLIDNGARVNNYAIVRNARENGYNDVAEFLISQGAPEESKPRGDGCCAIL